LVTHSARAILSNKYDSQLDVCDDFVECCRAIATGATSPEDGSKRIHESISGMRMIVPVRWHRFVFPELQRLAHEVCEVAKRNSGHNSLSLERLNDIFAVKTVRTVASLYSQERADSIGIGS
jgi:hypothetical protein